MSEQEKGKDNAKMMVAGSKLSEPDEWQKQIQSLEAKLAGVQQAAAAAGIGLYSLRQGTGELELSATAARLLGFPFLETTVSRADLQRQVLPEDWEFVKASLGVSDLVPFRVQGPDSQVRWLEAKGGERGVLTDVTLRKEAEQSLLRSNADLQQFSYVASHDLQEPLRTITTYAQLLQRRYREQLDQDAQEFIEFVVGASRRMDLLVRDLLAYSRSMQSDSRPMTEVNMNGVVAWTSLALQAELKATGGTLTHDDLPTVPGHELQLAQLMQHLVGNALKFRRLDVPPRVHVSAKEQNGFWVFSVRDNGIGIDPQYLDRIFGAFKRLHGKDVPGTGIGLAIAQNIVMRHGGQIWAESMPGLGSTFHFSLPATS